MSFSAMSSDVENPPQQDGSNKYLVPQSPKGKLRCGPCLLDKTVWFTWKGWRFQLENKWHNVEVYHGYFTHIEMWFDGEQVVLDESALKYKHFASYFIGDKYDVEVFVSNKLLYHTSDLFINGHSPFTNKPKPSKSEKAFWWTAAGILTLFFVISMIAFFFAFLYLLFWLCVILYSALTPCFKRKRHFKEPKYLMDFQFTTNVDADKMVEELGIPIAARPKREFFKDIVHFEGFPRIPSDGLDDRQLEAARVLQPNLQRLIAAYELEQNPDGDLTGALKSEKARGILIHILLRYITTTCSLVTCTTALDSKDLQAACDSRQSDIDDDPNTLLLQFYLELLEKSNWGSKVYYEALGTNDAGAVLQLHSMFLKPGLADDVLAIWAADTLFVRAREWAPSLKTGQIREVDSITVSSPPPDYSERIQDYLKVVGEEHGIQGISFDNSDICKLALGRFTIWLVYIPQNDSLLLLAPVLTSLPEDEEEMLALVRLLLRGATSNYFFCGSGGFAMHTDDQIVFLYGHIQNVLQRSDNRLLYCLPSFVGLTLAWRQTLEKTRTFQSDISKHLDQVSQKLDRLKTLQTTLRNSSKLRTAANESVEGFDLENTILRLIVDFKSQWE